MGIGTIAVFSDVDAEAPFVSEADEGFALGGEVPADSYLRVDRILEAAKATGADAIHPGYGFLSENADFAQAVIDAGFIWIGPNPDSVRAMGSKIESKRIAGAAGVPVLRSHQPEEEGIEYPVLVKASAGGGGKGMRVVIDPADLAEAIAGARREALSAFADDTVFVERYLSNPRHIEIQVFGDRHGNVAALFERECSIQRRHQKILEESPSPILDEATRARMQDAAVAVARAVNYQSAGTVEFIYREGEFFFLEMNTRLQVEHPVTEELTGVDLVRWQIKVAQGDELDEEILDPARVGHAIEVRLYAEDPATGFLPVSGRIDRFQFDDLVGVRVESAVESGTEISSFYDPMIAKVIAWGETRDEAASLLARALQTARIHGPINNRDLLVRILRHPEFLQGRTDTGFLDRNSPAELGAPLPDSDEMGLAAIAATVAAGADRSRALLPALAPAWRNNPSQLQTSIYWVGGERRVVGYRDGVASIDGQTVDALRVLSSSSDRVGLATSDHFRWFAINRVGSTVHVDGPSGYSRLVEEPPFPTAVTEDESGSLHAPMPGKVIKVLISSGDPVVDGQVVLVMEAMKMEHSLRAPHSGVVREVRVSAGDQVEAGATLIVVD